MTRVFQSDEKKQNTVTLPQHDLPSAAFQSRVKVNFTFFLILTSHSPTHERTAGMQ